MIFFHQELFAGRVFYRGDITNLHYPLIKYVKSEGSFWNPFIFCGYPQIGNSALGLFSPFLHFFTFLFGVERGLTLLIVTYYFIGVMGAFLFSQEIGASRLASLVTAVVFAFNGFLIDYHDTLHGIATMVWLPFILYYIEKALKQKRPVNLYTGIAGLIFGIQFLGGHFQFSYYIAGAVFFYVLWRLFIDNEGIHIKSGWQILIIIFLLGVGIAAVQLLPTYELVNFTARKGKEYLQISSSANDSLSFFKLLSFVFPHYNGVAHYCHFQPFYIGLIPISISIFGIAKSNLRKTGIFIFLCAISIAVAAGNNLPFFRIIYRFLPLFSLFRDPLKTLYIFVMGISILSGVGMDELLKNRGRKRDIFLLILLALFCFFLIPAYIILSRFPHIFSGMPAYLLCYVRKTAEKDLAYFVISTIIFVLVYKLIVAPGRFSKRSVLGGFIAAFIFTDMFVNTRHFKFDTKEAKTHFMPSAVSFLRKDKELTRVYSYNEDRNFLEFSDSVFYYNNNFTNSLKYPDIYLAGNFPASYFLSSFSGYSSFPFGRLLEYSRASFDINPFRKTAYADFINYPNLLKLSNIKYIILSCNRVDKVFFDRNSSFRNVYKDNLNRVYLYKDYFQRAIFVSGFTVIKSARQILNTLKSPFFDPQKTVIIEEAVPYQNYAGKPYKLMFDKYTASKIGITIRTYSPGFLVLLDSYYPGWHAYVDGKSAKIYRADYLYRAVYIPCGGIHKIKFIYRPLTVIIGIVVSFSALAGCGILIGGCLKGEKNK